LSGHCPDIGRIRADQHELDFQQVSLFGHSVNSACADKNRLSRSGLTGLWTSADDDPQELIARLSIP
jgi:hypothetical protein